MNEIHSQQFKWEISSRHLGVGNDIAHNWAGGQRVINSDRCQARVNCRTGPGSLDPSWMAESWITSRIHVIPMLSTGPMAAPSLPACPARLSSPSSCPSVGDQHYPYNLSVLTPTTTSYLISTCHLNKQIIFLPGQPISSFLYTYILNNHWLLYNLISGLLVRPKRKPQLKHHFLADTFF